MRRDLAAPRAGRRRLSRAVVVGYATYRIWDQGSATSGRPADAIVVLGAAQYDGRPSPVFAARLDHAVDLYQAGRRADAGRHRRQGRGRPHHRGGGRAGVRASRTASRPTRSWSRTRAGRRSSRSAASRRSCATTASASRSSCRTGRTCCGCCGWPRPGHRRPGARRPRPARSSATPTGVAGRDDPRARGARLYFLTGDRP